jgi:hypothetical protein
MRLVISLLLTAFLLSLPLFGQAQSKCVWVNSPSENITYTPWVVTDVGVFWDTKERTCCKTYSGQVLWYTSVRTRTCSGNFGGGVGMDGPSVSWGGSYGWSETIVSSTQGPGTAMKKTKQTSCLFSSETVIDQHLTFAATHTQNEMLVNEWYGSSSVTFDGQIIPIGGVIDLSQVALGNHSYIVTRTAGPNVEIYDFTLTVVSPFDAAYAGTVDAFFNPQTPAGASALGGMLTATPLPVGISYPNPTAVVCFTNDSEFAIDVDIAAMTSQVGVEVDVLDNQTQVLPGETIERVVEFYTLPGFVVPAGVPLLADVEVRFAGPFGELLASESVQASSCFLNLGTDEDFELMTTVNGGPNGMLCAQYASAGDLVEFNVYAPNGGFQGDTHALLFDLFTPGFNPVGAIPSIPEIRVSANYGFLTTWMPLAPRGTPFTLMVPPGLAGLAARFQGVAISATAQNGLVACTDAHDLRFN